MDRTGFDVAVKVGEALIRSLASGEVRRTLPEPEQEGGGTDIAGLALAVASDIEPGSIALGSGTARRSALLAVSDQCKIHANGVQYSTTTAPLYRVVHGMRHTFRGGGYCGQQRSGSWLWRRRCRRHADDTRFF